MVYDGSKTSSPSSRRRTLQRRRSESSIPQIGDGNDPDSLDSISFRRSQTEDSSMWSRFTEGDNLIAWNPITEALNAICDPFTETSAPADDEATSTASQESSTSPRISIAPRRWGMAGIYTPSWTGPMSGEEELAEYRGGIDRRRNSEISRKIDEMMDASETPYSSDTSPPNSNTDCSTESSASNEPTPKAQARAEKEKATESNEEKSCNSKGFLLCIILIVGVVVAYFVPKSKSTMPATSDPVSSSPTVLPRTPNPSEPPSSTFSPSASPTLPFLYDPPSLEDCNLVRSGDAVLGQDLLTARNFELHLNVGVESLVGLSKTMDLLELEIQQKLIPKLVGCGEGPNRKLRHHRNLSDPNRYIVGNGSVQLRPASLEGNTDCPSRLCLRAAFNMDLFLKTAEEQYFVVVNLLEDIFGGDLVDLLQLERSIFVSVMVQSVMVQSVMYKGSTMSPSSIPTLIPSETPSQKPTELPSKLPTLAPTERPSFRPTPGPTLTPSVAPTLTPTTSPPTLAPTKDPTRVPTVRPSQMPTPSPTMVPSSSPTGENDRKGYYQELDRPLRIACGGDSLTRGRSGGTAGSHTYPSQLRSMLGSNFEVYNYGRNAAIARRGRSLSYARQPEFQNSLNLKPDIYLLMLGTNDSMYWGIQGQNFDDSLEWLVNKIRNSSSPESPPRIILAIPPWVKMDNFGIRSSILVNRINPEIQAVARNENVQLVNMYDETYNQGDFYTNDGVHLNQMGYETLATAWKVAIQCNQNGICEVGESCETCPGDCYLNCSYKK